MQPLFFYSFSKYSNILTDESRAITFWVKEDKKEEKWETVWFSQWEPAEKKTQYAHSCYVYRFGTCLDQDGNDTTNWNIEEVDKKKLDFMCGHSNHQSVAAICAAHDYSTVEEILKATRN